MASRADLKREVERLNKKYCKNTKNELMVSGAYGGVKVNLTGKEYKRGKKTHWYKGSLGSGQADITYGYTSPKATLFKLYEADSKGWLKSSIKRYEPKKKRK